MINPTPAVTTASLTCTNQISIEITFKVTPKGIEFYNRAGGLMATVTAQADCNDKGPTGGYYLVFTDESGCFKQHNIAYDKGDPKK